MTAPVVARCPNCHAVFPVIETLPDDPRFRFFMIAHGATHHAADVDTLLKLVGLVCPVLGVPGDAKDDH